MACNRLAGVIIALITRSGSCHGLVLECFLADTVSVG